MNTCPLFVNKMENMKYDIYGHLVSYDDIPTCRLTGYGCKGCTKVEINNLNSSSKITLIRPDGKTTYEVKLNGVNK